MLVFGLSQKQIDVMKEGKEGMMYILIKNVEIIMMNEKNDIIYGDFYIVGNCIVVIGKNLYLEKVDKVIDVVNKMIVLGFIYIYIYLC